MSGIPNPREPVSNPNGFISPSWYRFFAQFYGSFTKSIATGTTLTLSEIAAASVPVPPAGSQTAFFDSADHNLKRKDSSGAVTIIG